MRIIITLLIVFVLLITLCSLMMAITSATASLSNGIALGNAANALKAGQNVNMIAVLGIIIVASLSVLSANRKPSQLTPPPYSHGARSRKTPLYLPQEYADVQSAAIDDELLAIIEEWNQ